MSCSSNTCLTYRRAKKGRLVGLVEGAWDQKVPPMENCAQAHAQPRELASAASWRVACRLKDLGFGSKNWPPDKYVQKWPTGAWDKFADKKNVDPMVYDNKAHGLLFP